jgi:small subunit ribosomal protein S3
MVLGDLTIRNIIKDEYKTFSDAGIAKVEIERNTQDISVNIHSARPGILIGRDGERVKKLRGRLEKTSGKRMQLNILEVTQPEMNAYLVARNIADQIERRVAFRRALRQGIQRTMQAGALGIKIIVKGRINGAEIARTEKIMEGRVPLHNLNADIDYDFAEAATQMGRIGIKVWIFKGTLEPEPIIEALDEIETIQVTVRPDEDEPIANDSKEIVAGLVADSDVELKDVVDTPEELENQVASPNAIPNTDQPEVKQEETDASA